MGEWESRNHVLDSIREALRADRVNLDLANRYWSALAGDKAKGEADYRSGKHVIEAYREAAMSSTEGKRAFAHAYRDLFENSGESPRSAYFDEGLIIALKTNSPDVPDADRSNVEWILQSIGIVPR
jgi:hypothetical protein